MPIFHEKVSLNSFKFVLDKVKQRLSTWKTRTLSFAGRVTLAKSFIQAMSVYVMQSTVLPRGVYDEIAKLCRSFIWGDEENQRKVHLLSWEKLCKPKKEGGLGLRSTRTANSAFLMKTLWNFCNKSDSLWVTTIRSKYKCGWKEFPIINSKKKGSNFWNGQIQMWLTNAERQRRRMSASNLCLNCYDHEESLFHCFRDCRKSISVWLNLNIRNQEKFFWQQNWKNWLEENLKRCKNDTNSPF